MKAFHTIAIPHKDILQGRLTMDVFAADLYETSQNRGPDEYRDADTFFKKTYTTEGLKSLLSIVEKRLTGEGGDPVIQLQTPFGGGKTHALIALYHKAKEWKAKVVVLCGTAMGTEETLWGAIERQLTGKVERLTGRVAPGREKIRELLSEKQPVLILMDEVLEYVTKASGVRVEESSLAAQTIAFMQELTETVSVLDKCCLVVTLPSSITEHFDEMAERLYIQLQKIAGRLERIYTPVEEKEIAKVIRQRLFSSINEKEVKEVVEKFVEYAEREEIIPQGMEPSEYRDRFIDSYPFMPEVIDVLYHRWGSYPTFQRTRGVLRILSLVIYFLKDQNIPFISLSDFNLANQEIREELLKHIGREFNAVIGQDITDAEAGAKKVDISLGGAYQGLRLGTRAATTIFLYSFSGGAEKGATIAEIKRCAAQMGSPASVVVEAIEKLTGKLFYLQSGGDKYFFSNRPNLNRILLTKMDNIKAQEVADLEEKLLRESLKRDNFKVFLWKENPNDIPDTADLKLVVLKKEDSELIGRILESKGSSPRVNRNTLFFLHPLESERIEVSNILKKKLAYNHIKEDKNLSLSEDQLKEIERELNVIERDLKESIRKLYRMVAIPYKEGKKELDLGIPTFGERRAIDSEIYDRLRTEEEILEKIVPSVIKKKYLGEKEYLLINQIYESSLKTPGEMRFVSRSALEEGICEGG